MFEHFDLWNLFCKLADSFLLTYIPYRIFPKRNEKHGLNLLLIPFIIISAVLYGVEFAFGSVNFLFFLALYIASGMIYACLFFYGRVYLKIIIQCTCVCCMMFSHIIAVSLVSRLAGASMMFTWAHVLVVLFFLFSLMCYLIHFAFIPKTNLPAHNGIGMAVLTLMMTLYVNIIRGLRLFEFHINMSLFLLPVIVILSLYYLYFNMVKEFEQKQLMGQQLALQQKHLEESTEIYNDMRHLRHELKNHVFFLNNLLDQEKYNDLREYFKKFYRQEYAINLIESGNNVIDAILNQKVAYAKSKKIRVSITVALPDSLDIDESRICAVISNLFDNAIDASEHLSAPEISMTVRQKGCYIHIACRNTVDYDVLKENAILATTKKTRFHGVGLQVIQNIVETYDGIIDFHMEDMTFVVDILLKNGEARPD